jgi:hypothetical protein
VLPVVAVAAAGTAGTPQTAAPVMMLH